MYRSAGVFDIKISWIDRGVERVWISLNYGVVTGTFETMSASTAANATERSANMIRIFIVKISDIIINYINI
mgnify:FL=1